jgi:hypothetical protein
MHKLTSVAGAGIVALALGIVLAGCGSNSSTEDASSSTVSSAQGETAQGETSVAAEPTDPAAPSGQQQTIQDYITENGIQEVAVKPGDPGSPTVNLPVPAGWQHRTDLPEAPYGAFFFPGSAEPNNPPRIMALMSKLTGDVDPAKVLEYAPGELRNMPGYRPMNRGTPAKQGAFDAFLISGMYLIDGREGIIAQKTVVIPANDAVYVLQLNAYAAEAEAPILGEATRVIDEQTTISV